MLPQSRRFRHIETRCVSFVTFFTFGLGIVPALVNTTTVVVFGAFFTPAVEKLYFVVALQIDS
ncbi:hypothetical protein D3C87_1668770 [compost metagenome]